LRISEAGEIVIEPENDTEIWDDVEIDFVGITALYTYVLEDGCAHTTTRGSFLSPRWWPYSDLAGFGSSGDRSGCTGSIELTPEHP